MEKAMDEQKIRILEGGIKAFNAKGLKFTMDDLAGILGMSKKTLYKVYRDKEELFLSMVDYIFDRIKDSEAAIISDDTLKLEDKIKKILGVMPEGYKDIDFRQLYLLKGKYPHIYNRVEERLENGWETTISLLEDGKKAGIVKDINLQLFKMMMEAALEQFFQRDILIRNNLTYSEALDEVVSILLKGAFV